MCIHTDEYVLDALSRASYKLQNIKNSFSNGLTEEMKEKEKEERAAFFSKIDLSFVEPLQSLIGKIENTYKNENSVYVFTEFPTIVFFVPNVNSRDNSLYFSCVFFYEQHYLGDSIIIYTFAKTNDPTSYSSAKESIYNKDEEFMSLCPNSKLLDKIAEYPFFDYEQNKILAFDIKKLSDKYNYGYGACNVINKQGKLILKITFSCKKTPENVISEYVEFIIKMLNESRFITVLPSIINYYKKMFFYRSEYYRIDRELDETRRKIDKLVKRY